MKQTLDLQKSTLCTETFPERQNLIFLFTFFPLSFNFCGFFFPLAKKQQKPFQLPMDQLIMDKAHSGGYGWINVPLSR